MALDAVAGIAGRPSATERGAGRTPDRRERGSTTKGGVTFGVALGVVIVANLILIWLFHDKAWIPSDDGHYVHVADRLVDGQVLNGDVEELHPGYVHFVHAASLKLFGGQVVSLRYPLMALMFGQSMLTFWLFWRARATALAAGAAAIVISAIGTLQIANPTTSLYALAFTLGLAAVLVNWSPDDRRRAFTVGFLLGVIFLFRQLTAVFVTMGALAFLLTEEQPTRSSESRQGERSLDRTLARALLVSTVIGLLAYLAMSSSRGATWLFGLVPIIVLVWAVPNANLRNGEVIQLARKVAVGAAISVVPLVAYHLWHGSLLAWFRDTFVRSLSVNNLEHIDVGRYIRDLLVPAIRNTVTGSVTERLNGVYWIVLVLAALWLGFRMLAHLWRLSRSVAGGGRAGLPRAYAVPVVVLFYALVSVFNQIPYYLYLSAGLSLVGLLWVSSVGLSRSDRAQGRGATPLAFALIGLSALAVLFHAGQPYTRSYVSVVAGERVDLVESELPNMGLWIDPDEEQVYHELLSVIDAETDATDVIFTTPNDAELYFLSDRANGFRLFNPTISLLDDAELDEFVADFEQVAPALIVHDTLSAYNTELTNSLLDAVLERYDPIATVHHYEVYRLR